MNIRLKLKLGLECIGIKNTHLLYPIAGHTCDDIEWFMMAKNKDVVLKYCHHELSKSVIEVLLSLPVDIQPSASLIRTFVPHPIAEVREELFYFFEPHVSLPESKDVVFQGDTLETFDTFAIVVDGIVASRAWSIRLNDNAAEIAVETKEEHRRKGYGKQVVSAWVKHQLLLGKTPMYAHRKYNLESKALAESLGATLFADVISYH